MKSWSFIFILLFPGLFYSCTEDQNTPSDVSIKGYEYFPVDSGLTRFYRIDSVYWDEFTGINDTNTYLIKEVIAGAFIDNQGRSGQRIERFRQDNNGNWMIDRVWSSIRTKTTAEVTEENNRFIKLVFPFREGEEWNGNAFNTLDEQTYEVISAGGSDQLESNYFDETVRVLQEDDVTAISRDYAEERYAAGIGLYYRENVSYKINIITSQITGGYNYKETLISFQSP